MINYLVKLQIDSTADDFMAAATPALIKYKFLDENYKIDDEKSTDENLHDIINKLTHTNNHSVLVFDAECIDEKETYSSLAMEIFRLAGAGDQIKKIKSSLSHEQQKAGLAVQIDDDPVKKIWDQRDDWVSEEFLSFMDQLLEYHFKKRLLSLPTSDQCARLLIVDAEDAAPLEELIRFHKNGYSPRELYRARVASTWAVALAGCVVSIFIGWYFLGFLWSLLVAIGAWALITIGLVLKHAWVCAQEEEAEDLRQKDPEAYTKAMIAALVEEAAKREGDSDMGKKLKKLAALNQPD